MSIDFECRRCAGRRKLSGEKKCFVCLGKGRIRISSEEVREIYQRRDRV